MIRYATERYLDIELILEDESGLKIPKTAVTEKEFYIVPQDYITSGGAAIIPEYWYREKRIPLNFRKLLYIIVI